jgi:hypothetical protein
MMEHIDLEATMNKVPASVTVTVHVKETRRFWLRKVIALRLIILGIRVLGCSAHIVIDEEPTYHARPTL